MRETAIETYDMVVLYADPLFKVNSSGEVEQRHHCFEHKEEYNCLTTAIKQTGRFFRIKRMNFSYSNIEKIRAMKPPILHLSIHGHYDDKQQFKIAIEKELTGEEDTLDEKIFARKMKNQINNINLVIVNSCQSVEISQILMEFKIPVVIGVNWSNENMDEDL